MPLGNAVTVGYVDQCASPEQLNLNPDKQIGHAVTIIKSTVKICRNFKL
jgi:hypothetical protein